MTSMDSRVEDWTSFWVWGAILLRGRWRIIRWALLGGALAALVLLFRPPMYASTASFVPSSSDADLAGLSSLAARLGVAVPAGNQAHSPTFYRRLLNSTVLLKLVAADTVVVDEMDGQRVALLDLFEVRDLDDARRLEKGARHLGSILETSADNSTGIVRLSVATEWPSVSLAIATAVLNGVHDINRRMRQGEAAAERSFIEGRLTVVREELGTAESHLEAFLRTNRRFDGSPELSFQHDRLEREVSSRQQVLTSLTQAYEDARIREVRNTPVITVLEVPSLPALPEPRHRALLGVFGVILGGFVGLVVALSGGALRSPTTLGHTRQGFEAALQEFRSEVGSPKSWLRGLMRGDR